MPNYWPGRTRRARWNSPSRLGTLPPQVRVTVTFGALRLHGLELRALRRLQRDYPNSPYLFTGERKGPLTDSTVRKMIARAGIAAGLEFPVHPHMLRHAAGYKLANDGQDTMAIQHYLGHRNIAHTVRYTELSPERFKDFWQD